MTTIINC